jgi:hypothetical protein
MKTQDILGFTLSVGFGLWWIVLPHSVLKLYSLFHGNKISLPQPFGIRIAGFFWLILIACVYVTIFI